MPWMLSPQHAAVMVYPRPRLDSPELDRLYAFGIDAARLVRTLLAKREETTLDGVTGLLRINRDRQVTRELTAAQFENGEVKILDEPRP